MTSNRARPVRPAPIRVLIASGAALALPALTTLLVPGGLGVGGALLWLLGLAPVLLVGVRTGLAGSVRALLAGLAVLAGTVGAAFLLGRPLPETLAATAAAWVAISLAFGWAVELLHRRRDEVEGLALTDLLTRLPNRRHALAVLENEFAAAQRGRPLSVVLFDLDDFKQYNDKYGHQVGDEALQAFAGVLLRTTRRMNLSARLGGEEFLTVLAGSDAEGALLFAERVRTALRARNLGSPPLTVTAGVAEYRGSVPTSDALLASADAALYEAKAAGRNCTRVHGAARPSSVAEAENDPPAGVPGAAGLARPPLPSLRLPSLRRRRATASGRSSDLSRWQATEAGERRILVVEDDTGVRRLIATLLKREGFQVLEAADVPTALSFLELECDVVLSNVHFRGTNGERLFATVRERWPGTQLVLMAGIEDAKPPAFPEAGGDRYLLKPFGIPELRARVGEALFRREEALARASRSVDGAAPEHGGLVDDLVGSARALVRAVELRDPSARGQFQEVVAYAMALADAADPDGLMLDRASLRLACELYDVGKIAIPEGILKKAGRLTEEELDEVRQHVITGSRLLESLLEDDVVLAAARWHHEKWDGQGYPDGLSGEEIPLAARVVAVAEALAAMTRPRPYRGALSWKEALRELRTLSGKQFDPFLVELLAGWEKAPAPPAKEPPAREPPAPPLVGATGSEGSD